jgi:transposase
VDIRRERDIEQLRRIALTQQTQIRNLLDTLQSKCDVIDELRGDSGELQQTIELLNRLQEAQAREEDEHDTPKPKKKGKPQRGHGPKEQPELERIEKLFELDEPDRACPSCGGRLEPLKGQFESSEMVDVLQVSYKLVEVKRQKYTCRCGGHVDTALGPQRAIEGGRYSLAFAVKVAIDKYVDHLPMARQTRIMKRHGLELTTQTLWDQLWALSRLLRPCYDGLYEQALAAPVLGLDQTGWKRLNKKNAKPWQIWCLTTPNVIYHRIREDKSTASWNALLGSYAGVVVCDAMSTHGAKGRNKPAPTIAGCWAHVLRKFRDAEADFPEAVIALEAIAELYQIDERARGPDHLRDLRQAESGKVLGRLHAWLTAQTALKTTTFGNAIRYALGNWARLTRFLDDPNIPLDNNRTERAIRGPVVGRKNHYGSKSVRGTEVAAIFYSLIETAKLNDVDPAEYLLRAATQAPGDEVLLPTGVTV